MSVLIDEFYEDPWFDDDGDDFYDREDHDKDRGYAEWHGDDVMGCCFPSKCLHPSFHHYTSECFTVGMLEESEKCHRELNRRDNSKVWDIVYGFRDFVQKIKTFSPKELVENWMYKQDDFDIPF